MQQNRKTQTDEHLESYFQQEQIAFRYEPFRDKGQSPKNPDYLFEKKGLRVLIENKEIEEIPHDRLIPNQAQLLDIGGLLNLLRRRVDSASKQLKPYHKTVDY